MKTQGKVNRRLFSKTGLSKIELSLMSDINSLTNEVTSQYARYSKLTELKEEAEKKAGSLAKELKAFKERLSKVERDYLESEEELSTWGGQQERAYSELEASATQLSKKIKIIKAASKELGVPLNISEAEKALRKAKFSG